MATTPPHSSPEPQIGQAISPSTVALQDLSNSKSHLAPRPSEPPRLESEVSAMSDSSFMTAEFGVSDVNLAAPIEFNNSNKAASTASTDKKDSSRHSYSITQVPSEPSDNSSDAHSNNTVKPSSPMTLTTTSDNHKEKVNIAECTVETTPSINTSSSANNGGCCQVDEEAMHGDVDVESADGVVYKVYKRRWFGLLSLALLNLIVSWGWLSFAAISSIAADAFGLASESPINWLSTVVLFSYVVASPLVALVLTRRGVKDSILICASLITLGNWLRYIGTVRNKFGLVMFGQILIGFSQPFSLSAANYYTDMWFTSRSRVSANAIATIANPLGGAIAQLVGPAMVTEPGQLKDFILVTAAVATGFGITAIFVPRKPQHPPCRSATIVKLPLVESLKLLVKNKVFLAVFVLFSIYVALFNAYTTFVNQIMEPYGYSSDEAGLAGAILIIAGIVCCAVTSPIIDRTHCFVTFIWCAPPVMAACYIALNFTATRSLQLIGPYLVSGVLGAVSFSILPVLLEWIQEQTSPVTPALPSALLWNGGNFLGAVLIIAMDALKNAPTEGTPPGNMKKALILQTVFACVGIPCLCFVRESKNKRIALDRP